MRSGIENFCIRKGVDLIGVSPASCITYPKLLKKQDNELASGHSHFILVGKDKEATAGKKDNSSTGPKYKWGEESAFKYDLAMRIASGDKKSDAPPCKIVTIVMADDD